MTGAALAQDRLAVGEERAGLAVWLAVVAGALGATMATLDVSIVNSALPTIQGEIGASGTAGTWIATAYLVAEITAIPIASWVERILGLRTFLIVMAALFTGFSVLCGVSDSLPMMIAGRVGQGFTGGALIPTAQTIIATRLPRRQRLLGISVLGVCMTVAPLVGPVAGGLLTQSLGWHYAFFINVPIGTIMILLAIAGVAGERLRPELLAKADWLGIVGLILGLGGLTVVLEEGQRELWLQSAMIRAVVLVSLAGFALLAAGQLTAARPVIKLRLFRDRQFAAVGIVGMTLGMVIYGAAYAIPQFLAAIAGYDALQSGEVVLLSGFPSLVMIALAPVLLRYIDIRVAVAASLVIMGWSALIDSHLSAQSDGGDFVAGQLIRGVGQILGMLFINQASVLSASKEDAGDAAGIFNAARNLGGSAALAGIAVIQDQRLWLHARRLEEGLPAGALRVQAYVAQSSHALGSAPAGLASVAQLVQREALAMTFNDLFWLLGVFTFLTLPVSLLLRPLPKDAPLAMGH